MSALMEGPGPRRCASNTIEGLSHPQTARLATCLAAERPVRQPPAPHRTLGMKTLCLRNLAPVIRVGSLKICALSTIFDVHPVLINVSESLGQCIYLGKGELDGRRIFMDEPIAPG